MSDNGDTAVCIAVSWKYYGALELLLNRKAIIHNVSQFLNTIIRNQKYELVKLFIKNYLLNTRSEYLSCPYSYYVEEIIRTDNVNVCRYLLNNKIVNLDTILDRASRHNLPKVGYWLTGFKIHLNEFLVEAIEKYLMYNYKKDNRLIKLLLWEGADPNVEFKDRVCETMLNAIAEKNDLDVFNLLIQCNAKINKDTLRWAIYGNSEEICRWLLEQKGIVPTSNELLCMETPYNEEICRLLLSHGADVNFISDGNAPVFNVDFYCNKILRELLLSYNANFTIKDKQQNSILHRAAQHSTQEACEFLIQHGVLVNNTNKNGYTALHLAVVGGNVDHCHTLLQHGADPNITSNAGFSPLYFAFLQNRTDLCELLLSYGAEMYFNRDEYLAHDLLNLFYYDVAEKGKEIIKLFLARNEIPVQDNQIINYCSNNLEFKVNVNNYSDFIGTHNLLEVAIVCGRKDLCLLYLTNNRSSKVWDPFDNSLLELALRYGYKEIVELLISFGAKFKINISYQLNCLDWYKRKNIVGLLIQHQINLNRTNDYNETILHTITKYYLNAPIHVKILLKHGADPNLQNSEGMTPLHIASMNGREEVCKLLLEYGAVLNLQDNNGNTPLDLANKNHRVGVQKFFRENMFYDFNICNINIPCNIKSLHQRKYRYISPTENGSC